MCVIGQKDRCALHCEWAKVLGIHCTFRSRIKYPPLLFDPKLGNIIDSFKNPLPDNVLDKYRRDPIMIYEKQNWHKVTFGYIAMRIRKVFDKADLDLNELSKELDNRINKLTPKQLRDNVTIRYTYRTPK